MYGSIYCTKQIIPKPLYRVSNVQILEKNEVAVLRQMNIFLNGAASALIEKITWAPYHVRFELVAHDIYEGYVDNNATAIDAAHTKLRYSIHWRNKQTGEVYNNEELVKKPCYNQPHIFLKVSANMKQQILVTGRNADIVAILDRNINKNENWRVFTALEDEQAITLFHQHAIDIVLFSSGIEQESEAKLRKHFTLQNPQIIIIQHYGGGSALLGNEIMYALDSAKHGITIQDNPSAT